MDQIDECKRKYYEAKRQGNPFAEANYFQQTTAYLRELQNMALMYNDMKVYNSATQWLNNWVNYHQF